MAENQNSSCPILDNTFIVRLGCLPQRILRKLKKIRNRTIKKLRKSKRRTVKKLKRFRRLAMRNLKCRIASGWSKTVPYLLNYPQTRKKNRRTIHSDYPRIVIVGRNYSSNLCLSRAFGTAGYEVEVLRIFQKKPKAMDLMKHLQPDAYSRYVKAYYVCVSQHKNYRVVKKLLSIADPTRKMLLIPADDLCASIVDHYLDKLGQHYLIPNAGHQAGRIDHLMEKGVQKQLARDAGLPVINSCVIHIQHGQFEIPKSVRYPCFIKPNVSKNGLKSQMQKIDDEESLRSCLMKFSTRKNAEILVEDYMEIKREYSILGVSTPQGAIGPGFFGAEASGHNGCRGIALIGEVMDAGRHQSLVHDIVDFIGTLDFEGLFDVDLIETWDGKMYFVELNLRFGGSGYAITQSGINLPGMFADYMIQGKPLDKTISPASAGKHFISEKIMIEEYLNGYLTLDQMRSLCKKADIRFIQDDADRHPYQHFCRFYPIAVLMRIFHRSSDSRIQRAAVPTSHRGVRSKL